MLSLGADHLPPILASSNLEAVTDVRKVRETEHSFGNNAMIVINPGLNPRGNVDHLAERIAPSL